MYIEPIKVENKKEKNKINWLLIFIILISIIILVIIGLLAYLKSSQLDIYINGKKVKMDSDIFLIDETTNKVYVSIRDIAQYVGYGSHNGEYKVYSEDTTKAYVDSEFETASFFLNSTTISKVEPDSNNDYQNYTISEPVKMINNKMYVISDGFAIGFNVSFQYNVRNNTITIRTLPYLVSSYAKIATENGYKQMSDVFTNQKAILYGLIVCEKANEKFGVIDLKGNEVISPRYSNIEFTEYTREFIVTNSDNKVGIIHINGENKIDVVYDEIKILDKDLSLYIVKNNEKYGVINDKEKFIIHIEYDAIGIDASKFPSNNITNQYLLYGNVIPVKQNDMWGLFDINGNQILKPEYNALGCTTCKVTGANNLLLIPEYKAIVVNKGDYFGVVDNNGDVLIPYGLDTIYSITNAGEDTYSMVYYEKTYDVIQYLDSIYKKNKTENAQNSSSSSTASSSLSSSASTSSNVSTSSNTTASSTISSSSSTTPSSQLASQTSSSISSSQKSSGASSQISSGVSASKSSM